MMARVRNRNRRHHNGNNGGNNGCRSSQLLNQIPFQNRNNFNRKNNFQQDGPSRNNWNDGRNNISNNNFNNFAKVPNRPRKFTHRENFNGCKCDREECRQKLAMKYENLNSGFQGKVPLYKNDNGEDDNFGTESLTESTVVGHPFQVGGVGNVPSHPFASNPPVVVRDPVSGNYGISIDLNPTALDGVLKQHASQSGKQVVDYEGDIEMDDAPPEPTSFPPGAFGGSGMNRGTSIPESMLVYQLQQVVAMQERKINELIAVIRAERANRRALEELQDRILGVGVKPGWAGLFPVQM